MQRLQFNPSTSRQEKNRTTSLSCNLPVEEAVALMRKVPSFSPILKNLTYIYEESLQKENEFGGSDFGGYPTLKQRDDSYFIRESMNVRYLSKEANLAVGQDSTLMTMIFSRWSNVMEWLLHQRYLELSISYNSQRILANIKQTICFYMFVNEETEADMKSNGGLDESKNIGVWRIVVVCNLPYADGRRNGKIPKLLIHRLFLNARFS